MSDYLHMLTFSFDTPSERDKFHACFRESNTDSFKAWFDSFSNQAVEQQASTAARLEKAQPFVRDFPQTLRLSSSKWCELSVFEFITALDKLVDWFEDPGDDIAESFFDDVFDYHNVKVGLRHLRRLEPVLRYSASFDSIMVLSRMNRVSVKTARPWQREYWSNLWFALCGHYLGNEQH